MAAAGGLAFTVLFDAIVSILVVDFAQFASGQDLIGVCYLNELFTSVVVTAGLS